MSELTLDQQEELELVTAEREMEQDLRDAYIAGLREMADALENEPGIPTDNGVDIVHYCWTKDNFQAAVKRLGGTRTKEPRYGYMNVVRRFGPHSIRVNGEQNAVCTKTVVGTEEVTKNEREGEDLRPMVEVTKTVDIVEWDCGSILSSSDG